LKFLGQLFPYSLGNYLQILGTYVLNFGHHLIVHLKIDHIEAKEAALEKWSENICANINNARNIKDKWMEFRKFTNKKNNNTILPFIQPDNTVIFEENSKAIELEESELLSLKVL
jgi:hypothetical protein